MDTLPFTLRLQLPLRQPVGRRHVLTFVMSCFLCLDFQTVQLLNFIIRRQKRLAATDLKRASDIAVSEVKEESKEDEIEVADPNSPQDKNSARVVDSVDCGFCCIVCKKVSNLLVNIFWKL